MKKLAFLMAVLMLLSVIPMTAMSASAAAGADVAEVGGVKYATLQAAINAASNKSTIKLIANTTENVTFSSAKTLTLDGGDYYLYGSITVSGSSSTLNIDGGTFVYSTAGQKSVIYASNSAKVNIYGGCFRNSGNWRAIDGTGKAIVTIFGGTYIVDNTGAVVRADNCTVLVYGGCFCNSTLGGTTWGVIGGTMTGGYQYALGTPDNATQKQNESEMYQYISNNLPELVPGASVRMVKYGNALRFRATVSKATVNYIQNTCYGTNLTYGMIITQTKNLKGVPIFTKEALEQANKDYVDVPAENIVTTNGTVTFTADQKNIKSSAYTADYTAVPYVSFSQNGHTVRLYGGHNADTDSRSLAMVSYCALQDVESTSTGKYTNLVTDAYTTMLSGTCYSLFSASKRSVLNDFSKNYNGSSIPSLFGKTLSKYTVVLKASHTYAEERFAKKFYEYLKSQSPFTPAYRVGAPTGANEIVIGGSSDTALTLKMTADGNGNLFIQGSTYALQSMIETKFEGVSSALSAATNTSGTVYTRAVPRNDETESLYTAGSSGSVRVIFHNIWGWDNNTADANSNGKSVIREQIAAECYTEYAPDVICLQECCQSTGVGTSAAMRDKSGKLYVMNTLPSTYKEITNNKDGTSLTATPVIYNSAKLTLLSSGTTKFTGSGASYDKFFTWAIFQKGTKIFGVCSVHLDYQSASNGGAANRQAQILQVATKLKQLSQNNGNCAFIVGGDMNCAFSSESATLQKWIDAGFTDMYNLAVRKDNCCSYSPTYPQYDTKLELMVHDEFCNTDYSTAIDHAFVYQANANLSVSAYDMLKDNYLMCVSDHGATLVDFAVS